MRAITVVFDVTLPMFLAFQDLTRPIPRVGWSQYNHQLLNINLVVYVELIGKRLLTKSSLDISLLSITHGLTTISLS